ncbi:acetoacetate--CoA ligase, partial [Pseudomonas sp. MWU13-2625]
MQASHHPIWTPSARRLAGCHLTAFARLAQTAWNEPLPDYHSLWQASVDDPGRFWSLVWDYCGVIGDKGGVALAGEDDMLT